MKKLTSPQREALQTIAENTGRIGVHQDKRVHGTVATNLYVRGYIEGYNPDTGRSYHDESNGDVMPWYSGRYYWRLTKAGREVMGLESASEKTQSDAGMSPTAQLVVCASEARDAAMMAAYKAEATAKEAVMDAAYEAADAAYRAAKDAHRAARIAHGDRVAQ